MDLLKRRAEIGMLFFLAAEAMFFAGLVSAYGVLRAQAGPWPPPGQPRLPLFVTGINTLILIGSGLAFWRTRSALGLGLAVLGGSVFLGIQGFEWARLIQFGLTTTQNIYGGLFTIVIGSHALHVAVGLVFLLFVFLRTVRKPSGGGRGVPLTACRMYWTFVVAVWPILYAFVYF